VYPGIILTVVVGGSAVAATLGVARLMGVAQVHASRTARSIAIPAERRADVPRRWLSSRPVSAPAYGRRALRSSCADAVCGASGEPWHPQQLWCEVACLRVVLRTSIEGRRTREGLVVQVRAIITTS